MRGGSYKYIEVKKTQKQEFDLQTKLKQFNPTLHFTAVWFTGFLCCFFNSEITIFWQKCGVCFLLKTEERLAD